MNLHMNTVREDVCHDEVGKEKECVQLERKQKFTWRDEAWWRVSRWGRSQRSTGGLWEGGSRQPGESHNRNVFTSVLQNIFRESLSYRVKFDLLGSRLRLRSLFVLCELTDGNMMPLSRTQLSGFSSAPWAGSSFTLNLFGSWMRWKRSLGVLWNCGHWFLQRTRKMLFSLKQFERELVREIDLRLTTSTRHLKKRRRK